MLDINDLTLRDLQKESARAIVIIEATSNNIQKFNLYANNDSQEWYKAVITWYINTYGGLPSCTGPGKEIRLILDN